LELAGAERAGWVEKRGRGVGLRRQGTSWRTVSEQSAHYGEKLPDFLANLLPGTKKIPLAYESTGVETLFRDERDPAPRSRRVFAFH
jgi:type I restriction enzyme R subunit